MGQRDLEERVRSICLSLPEVTERTSHGSPAFFAAKQFVMLWAHGHHDHDFAHLWCAAAPGAQGDLIAQSPDRIFRPPYVGARGWIGVRLDGPVDFDEIEMYCEDAYRCVATKRQRALLEARTS
ncbi:MAG TPA: MmcQ/YjbR family DNA-binding protein [Acidimicrobiales bacterium]|nr:MmcQ/YjbR family DNA-binding protein [Acidimicrobiales bacterium]